MSVSSTTSSPDVEVDGTGRTLLPGLVDAHTHVFDGSLAQALAFGVTTELDMFSLTANLARQWGLAAERDDVADIRSSGVLATAPGGHPGQLLSGFDAATREALGDAAGPFDTVPDAGAARALVEAAHAAGVQAIAHAVTAQEAAIALDAGVDGLAHVWTDHGPDNPAADALAARVAVHGAFVVSTLAYFEVVTGDTANGTHAARALHRAGVPLLAGTDASPFAPTHGESMHRELVLLTVAGLTPEEALAAATAVPARHFGLADRGRIAPGLRADLLLVDGDPTSDIVATRSIVDVWRRGVRQERRA